jgi:hypothetical protein
LRKWITSLEVRKLFSLEKLESGVNKLFADAFSATAISPQPDENVFCLLGWSSYRSEK